MLEYDYHHKDKNGLTVLHYAAMNNMEKVVQTILARLNRYYIPVDIKDSSGTTPYLYAKRLNNAEIVDLFIEAGASPYILDKNEKCKYSSVKKRSDEKAEQVIQLKINGRLPQVRRVLAEKSMGAVNGTRFSSSRNSESINNNISSLLQLQHEGQTCEKFIKSTSVADSAYNSTTDITSYTAPRRHVKHLSDLFDIVSEQMTSSFCKPAQKPKSKFSDQAMNKFKMSSLAAIMKKPVNERIASQQGGKKRSQLRKGSRNDLLAKLH